MKHLFFASVGFSSHKLKLRLEGKAVLITGASFGIGECLAHLLAQSGCRLILVARTKEKLEKVQSTIAALGGEAEIWPCDLTEPDQVDSLVSHIKSTGGVDIVVSNAGRSIHRSIFDSLDRHHDVQRTMDLNFLAPSRLVLSLIPSLVERSGHVINVSALNVLLTPAPKWAAYQASKTAFDQWMRSIAPELRAKGVKTTTIYLPLVRTRMIKPTKAYDKAPALSPEEAASLICRAIVSQRRMYGPWWLMPAQLGSVLLRTALEMLMTRLSKTASNAEIDNSV